MASSIPRRSARHRGGVSRSPRCWRPIPALAAQIYPANYWYSLIDIPPEKDFPGTGPSGNGISPDMATQHHWINQIKANCNVCHQLGNKATREIPAALGTFASSVAAWDRRVQVGQDGAGMSSAVTVLGRARGLEMFANWTDRIAAGEVPPAPPRPKGLERNLVLTMWDWGGPATFAHDELATDKRNPTANAYGPIYGVDWGNDGFLTLDPLEHTAKETRIPVLDPKTPPGKPQSMPVPSPYWGTKLYWFDPAITNHAAMDSKGRVWMSARFRVPENQPAFCKDHPSAALAPMPTSFRQIQYYDPKTQQFKQVDICFDVHHVQFASDADETIYGNGPFSGAIGWVNTRKLEATGDAGAAQGWCRPWFDVNGDGKIDRAVDREIKVGLFYSVIPHPDGSVWGAVPGPMPGKIVRIEPKTCVSEAYEPPFDPASGVVGYTPRGIDVDSNGVIWTALAGSGHLASFDRRKCRILSGPAAMDGQHCREGWTLYPVPGPRFKGVRGDVAADFQVLQLRRPLQHARPRRESPAGERHELRFAARPAARRQLGRAARAVSARVLLARHGRPHRRSERRMEGARPLRGLRTERRLARRRRSGHAQRRRQVPDAARIRWRSR